MAQSTEAPTTPTSYSQGVDRLTAYLEALPNEGRDMWVDAAYRVYLGSLLESGPDHSSPQPRGAE